MIKLIVTDIDGTLLPEGTHSLDPEYFEVITRLREKGIQFAAASGRHWKSSWRAADTASATLTPRSISPS